MPDSSDPLTLRSSEAVFAVNDILQTVKFYREILGFQSEWLWGDPPTFAGVRWGKIHVLLCLDPELAQRVEGHQHFFRCDEIDALFDQHKKAGAPIISDIANTPWGEREYTVRDINGYHLRFTGREKYVRPAAARDQIPDFIRLDERMPTVDEFAALTESVGWTKNAATIPTALNNSLYAVVAVDRRDDKRDRIVGLVRVIGDGARFFYLQDVMVVPELQHQRIGSAMMESTMQWLKTNAPKGAFVGLFATKPGFYERHGFSSSSGGMSMGI